MTLMQNTIAWRPGQNKNCLLSASCGFAMLDGYLSWCGVPAIRAAGRFRARSEKSPCHSDHVDSDRAFSDRAFPTGLDHDQQDKVEMDRLLLRVWFASKHHHAISRCTLSRWRAFAHGAVAVVNSCSRKRSLKCSSSTKKAFAKR